MASRKGFRRVLCIRLPDRSAPSRLLSSSGKPPREDPFRVLGISRASTYRQAKEAFLKLALRHHPDKQPQGSAAAFVRIRRAFEAIRQGAQGELEVAEDVPWTEEQLHEFMKEQTNDFLSFRMDHDTRREVIETYEKLSTGGLDRGGSWLMARMLAEREKCQIENISPTFKQISAVPESRVQRRKKR